jgi:hypothetical protein
MRAYEDLSVYYGDLHSHCAVGYGHGSLQDAFENARLQLDFAAVTVHAHWPDIPAGEGRLTDLVDYHQRGFQKADDAWPHVEQVVEAHYEPGRFVTFLGHEWHSNQYGDHNVYFNGSSGAILRAASLDEMRQTIRRLRGEGIEAIFIPHHIGYKRGYRGINWDAFTPELSPVVEIMSMHGASESPNAPYPYLHTMGPRDWCSMYQYGLARGHIVGAIGSSDHHSAHPGSYGHGRMAVWAEALSRDAIWNAIQARRTYALTGDRIALAFSINRGGMGAVLPPSDRRDVSVSVEGGNALDYVEVLHNNCIIHRASAYEGLLASQRSPYSAPLKIHFEVGWGEKGVNVDWDVELSVVNGQLLAVEPRFRGHDIVAPQGKEEESYAFSQWGRRGEHGLWFSTRTWGNPTTTTSSTQGVGLKIYGDSDTLLKGQINREKVEVPLGDLIAGPHSGYLGGFLTPAYCFQRAVSKPEYTCNIDFSHEANTHTRDWYYVRVRQLNGQWAWSSPIWVEA